MEEMSVDELGRMIDKLWNCSAPSLSYIVSHAVSCLLSKVVLLLL